MTASSQNDPSQKDGEQSAPEQAGAAASNPCPGPDDQDALARAPEIVDRFGGIRPMASKMRIPVTTVQGWKKRGVIPGNRRGDVLRAARDYQVDLSGLLGGSPGAACVAASAAASSPSPSYSAPGAPAPNSFRAEMRAAQAGAQTSAQAGTTQAGAQAANQPSAPSGPAPAGQDALLGRIAASHRSAVRKSVMISTIIILAVGVIAVLLLAPGQQRIEQQVQANGKRIAALETRVSAGEARGKLALLSQALQNRLEQLKGQAAKLKQNIEGTGSVVESVAGPEGGSLAQRVGALETKLSALTAPVLSGVAPTGTALPAPVATNGLASLTGLLGRLKGLEQDAAGQAQLGAAIRQMETLLGGGTAEDGGDAADALAAAPAGSPLGQTLQGVGKDDVKAAAMLVALAQFRAQMNRQGPFRDDLRILYTLAGDDDPELKAAIDRLAPQAEAGVLTPRGIGGQLRGLAGDIVVASLEGEDVSVREKATARLNDLLQIRKDGALVSGTDTQARVARAQDLLDKGDVPGALAELQALQGGAKEKAQPVIENAQMNLLAGKVQALMTNKVMQQLQAGGAVSGGAQAGQLLRELESFLPGGTLNSDATGTVRIYTPAPSFPAFKLAPSTAP